jgi:ribosomal protein L30E
MKENTGTLIVASKETGLQVNSDKAKYMVMSQDQKAGQNHIIKNDNSSFEKVEQFKYWGTTLPYQNSIQRYKEQIEVRECLLSLGAEYSAFQSAI